MELTQIFVIEINQQCNLANEHKHKCPIAQNRNRLYPRRDFLTNQEIIDIIDWVLTNTKFNGVFAFHYLNEPSLEINRIEEIIKQTKLKHPQAKFLLWTNTIPNITEEQILLFNDIHATNYNHPKQKLDYYKKIFPGIQIHEWELDSRLSPLGECRDIQCHRPYTEIIIDAQGYGKLCCVDWEGHNNIGNVRDIGIEQLIYNFLEIRKIVANDIKKSNFCYRCNLRKGVPNLVQNIANKTIETLNKPKIAMVTVHYNKNKDEKFNHRYIDHFKWNKELYDKYNIDVIAVIEQNGIRPFYSNTKLLHYKDMIFFNLSATSNAGIRYACDRKYDIIIKTDIDIQWNEEALKQVIEEAQKGNALFPMYRMIEDENDLTKYVEAPKAVGTIGMKAENWYKAHYDERCVGYGSDDRALEVRIENAKIILSERSVYINHMPHINQTPQQEFNQEKPRIDHWGRNNNFNPEMFEHNHKFVYDIINDSETWGIQ